MLAFELDNALQFKLDLRFAGALAVEFDEALDGGCVRKNSSESISEMDGLFGVCPPAPLAEPGDTLPYG